MTLNKHKETFEISHQSYAKPTRPHIVWKFHRRLHYRCRNTTCRSTSSWSCLRISWPAQFSQG